MGEEREHSRSGKKSFGERGGFGHRNGGKSSERRGGFHKDGFHKGGFKKGGFRRNDDDREESFHSGVKRDGDRRFNRHDDRKDDRRGGFKKNGFKKDGFRSENRDNDRRFDRNRHFDRVDDRRDDRRSRDFEHSGEEGGNPRYKKFDGEHRFNHRDDRRDNRRENHRNGDFHKDFHKGSKGGFRDDRRDDRRDERRDNERRFDRRDNRRDDRRDDRRTNSRSNFRFEDGSRRNSDGTVSYPSQNPYTARRPGEPKMPKGLEWAMLSKEDRERLRGLSKEHAENIGLHILAAYTLQEENPELALEHAKWAAKQASRIDFARETLAFVAYRQGDYKLASKEFRTAMRMNGYLDYLPFIADCERGMGNLDKALEICMSDEAKTLRGEVKAEMFLVYAGVLADTGHADKAIELVHAMGRSKGLPGEYRMRAVQAEQYFLEEAGRSDEAIELESLLDKLEQQYADVDDEDINPDDIVIDYDLEHLNDDMMDEIGMSEDDAQFAPDEESDEESEVTEDSEDSEDSEETSNSENADNTDTIEMSAVHADEE
ncbi:hypothetical protein [Gardnerella swidsinskii]|uniref:hypothetical protein n=1 Tax=Gardnerella swidsinskii TaxID=2792979 RepID=UPI0036F468FA